MRESGLKNSDVAQATNCERQPIKSPPKKHGRAKKMLGKPPASKNLDFQNQDPNTENDYSLNKADMDHYNPNNDKPMSKYGISQQSIAWAGYHFLCSKGSNIAIADSITGADAARFGNAFPAFNITGLTRDETRAKQANSKFGRNGLNFLSYSDAYNNPDGAIFDGMLNSFNLHYLYSISGYSVQRITKFLNEQLDLLKVGGSLVIQGYLSPDNDENNHVLLELSDYRSNMSDIKKLSEAELLIRFSRTARPLDRSGCKGFFLEEIKPRVDHTRLFRLPLKWAQEFLLRKDRRKDWDQEISMEYTPFTFHELQREVSKLGARLAFFSPYWDKKTVENNYEPRCRMFNEDGTIMDYPATSYIAVVQKIDHPGSIFVRERRLASEKPNYLKIDHVKDETSGRIYDLVSRPNKIVDIIPYFYDADGRLTVYMRDNFARPIVNTVPRKGLGLDGKFWSGHLIEPITYEMALDEEIDSKSKSFAKLVKDVSGLDLKKDGHVFEGPEYYQAPLMIDEKVETVFVEVEKPTANQFVLDSFEQGFEKTNVIRGIDAQNLLHASHVGLVADGKSEIAMYYLMNKIGITPETWSGGSMPVGDHDPTRKRVAKVDDLIEDKKATKKSYKQTMRSGGTLSVHRSLFIEEGVEDGETTGMKSKSMEFAVPEDETINIAVVLPLTHDHTGEVMAGFQVVDYPVPARIEGASAQMDAPSFILPRDVKTIFDAKKYVAKQFGVKPDRVGMLGSSYFCDTGVTPQRIYPFVVASPNKGFKFRTDMYYAPIKQIAKITFKYCKPKNFMSLVCEAVHGMGASHSLSVKPQRDVVIKGAKYKPKLTGRDLAKPSSTKKRSSQTSNSSGSTPQPK